MALRHIHIYCEHAFCWVCPPQTISPQSYQVISGIRRFYFLVSRRKFSAGSIAIGGNVFFCAPNDSGLGWYTPVGAIQRMDRRPFPPTPSTPNVSGWGWRFRWEGGWDRALHRLIASSALLAWHGVAARGGMHLPAEAGLTVPGRLACVRPLVGGWAGGCDARQADIISCTQTNKCCAGKRGSQVSPNPPLVVQWGSEHRGDMPVA